MANQDPPPIRWSSAHLFAVRFAFVYFVLYNLPLSLGDIPHTESLGEKYEALWHVLVPWFSQHIFYFRQGISYAPTGDSPYEYTQILCYLTIALISAIVWFPLDRSRSNHLRLQEWLFFYIRLCLGSAMILYGSHKIFQVQFSEPDLYKLLQPHGDASLMDLLWTFMGASRGYCIFTGCIEIAVGILLFIPRMATLGAFLGIAAMSNIFAINVFYNVWVKVYSFHLLLMCIFLVLPQTRRFLNFFLLNRHVEPAARTELFNKKYLNIGVLVLQLFLAGFFVCYDLYQARGIERRDLASRPPFYGIWMIDKFTLDEKVVPPLLTDATRWQRVVFEYPNGAGIQSMSGSWTPYRLKRDMQKKTFAMEQYHDATKRFEFTFSSPDPQSLSLDGKADTNEIRITLHRVDEKQLLLLDHKIHWINKD
jgi:uncharacterized membrane protein YphA (DoxX/SURF4 family)